MSLSDLASLGSFISGVAVLVSLIYLALQVRQAERNQRGLMQQSRASRLVEILFQLAEPETAALFTKGLAGEDLSAAELPRFRWVYRAQMAGYEDSFFQHEQRLLTSAAFESVRLSAINFMANPGARAMWVMTGAVYETGFRNYIDRIIRETPMRPTADDASAWKAAVAAQLASAKKSPLAGRA